MPEEAEPARAGAGAAAEVPRLHAFNCLAAVNCTCRDGGGVVEGDEDGDGISEHFVPTAGDAFIGGVDQAIAGVDSVVDEAFDSGFIDLLGR